MPAGSPWTIHTTDTLTVWSGAWGMTYAANITPDPETGLKSSAWSEDAFLKAMKTGKHIGTGRDILPPMPWQMYAQLSDDDLKAIWAYLMTVPPIRNEVPDPVPPREVDSHREPRSHEERKGRLSPLRSLCVESRLSLQRNEESREAPACFPSRQPSSCKFQRDDALIPGL